MDGYGDGRMARTSSRGSLTARTAAALAEPMASPPVDKKSTRLRSGSGESAYGGSGRHGSMSSNHSETWRAEASSPAHHASPARTHQSPGAGSYLSPFQGEDGRPRGTSLGMEGSFARMSVVSSASNAGAGEERLMRMQAQLSAAYERFDQARQTSEARIRELTQELAYTKELVREREGSILSGERDARDTARKIGSLEGRNRELSRRVEELEAQNKELKDGVSKMDEVMAENVRAKERLAKMDNDARNMRRRLDDYEIAKEELEDTLHTTDHSLRTENDELRGKLTRMEAELVTETKGKMELAERVRSLETKLDKERRDSMDFKSASSNAEGQLHHLQEMVAQKEYENHDLRKALSVEIVALKKTLDQADNTGTRGIGGEAIETDSLERTYSHLLRELDAEKKRRSEIEKHGTSQVDPRKDSLIASLREEIGRLKHELEMTKHMSSGEKKQALGEVTREKERLAEELVQANLRVDEATSKLNHLDKMNTQLIAQLERTGSTTDGRKKEIARLRAVVESLQEEKSQVSKQMAELSQRVKDENGSAKRESQRCSELAAINTELTREVSELKGKVQSAESNLKTELDKISKSYNSTNNSMVEELNKALEDGKKAQEEVERQKETNQRMVDTVKAEGQREAHRERQEKEHLEELLCARLDGKDEEIESAKREIDSLKRFIAEGFGAYPEERPEKRHRTGSQRSSLSNQAGDNDFSVQMLLGAQQKLKSADASNRALEQDNAQLRALVAVMVSSIRDNERKMEALQRRFGDVCNKRLDRSRGIFEKVLRLSTEHRIRSERLKNAQSANAMIEENLRSAREDVRRHEDLKHSMGSRLDATKEELEALRFDYSKACEALTAASSDNISLSDKVEQLSQRLEESVGELTDMKKKFDAVKEEKFRNEQKLLDAANERIVGARDTISNLRLEIKEKSDRVVEIEKELVEVKKSKKKEKKQRKGMEHQLEKEVTRSVQLENTIHSQEKKHREEIDHIESDKRALHDQVETLVFTERQNHDQTKARLQIVEELKREMERKIEELRKEIDEHVEQKERDRKNHQEELEEMQRKWFLKYTNNAMGQSVSHIVGDNGKLLSQLIDNIDRVVSPVNEWSSQPQGGAQIPVPSPARQKQNVRKEGNATTAGSSSMRQSVRFEGMTKQDAKDALNDTEIENEIKRTLSDLVVESNHNEIAKALDDFNQAVERDRFLRSSQRRNSPGRAARSRSAGRTTSRAAWSPNLGASGQRSGLFDQYYNNPELSANPGKKARTTGFR